MQVVKEWWASKVSVGFLTPPILGTQANTIFVCLRGKENRPRKSEIPTKTKLVHLRMLFPLPFLIILSDFDHRTEWMWFWSRWRKLYGTVFYAFLFTLSWCGMPKVGNACGQWRFTSTKEKGRMNWYITESDALTRRHNVLMWKPWNG